MSGPFFHAQSGSERYQPTGSIRVMNSSRAAFTTSTDNDRFTTQDEGMVPVEIEGTHYHLACAEAMGLHDAWIAWHGTEKFATSVMDISPVFTDHEFSCAGCLELFPFVNTGRWS
jgi:hypothetical protein